MVDLTDTKDAIWVIDDLTSFVASQKFAGTADYSIKTLCACLKHRKENVDRDDRMPDTV